MPVLNAWAGAQTPGGFKVYARLSSGTSARLLVSRHADLSTPTYFGPVTADAQAVVRFTVAGLRPWITYYYALEVDGTLDTAWVGQCKTAPAVGTPTSFRFVASSCAGHALSGNGTTDFYPPGIGATGVSNRSSFDLITAAGGDFFIHLGDMYYRDISVNDPAPFRQAFDDVLAAPRQAALYKSKALVYMGDDHDGGPDNRDKTAASAPAWKQAYRERVPAYPYADASGLWQTWVYGRVRFIMTDNRTERDPCANTDDASKSMLGATQKQWFKDTLLAATEPTIVWINTIPWLGTPAAGGDAWIGYDTERTELGNFIRANNLDKRIVCISGDSHAIGIDDGRNNTWAGFPEVTVSSIDAAGGTLTGSWSHGWSGGRGRYATFDVVDTGKVTTITASLYADATLLRAVSIVRRNKPARLLEVTGIKAKVDGSVIPVTVRAKGDLSTTPYKQWVAAP